mmetsp:Transcript_3509/g.10244  ORF Transcript_3509/g.10244 Transcript_3509/m.10244 type:complete len:347 (+) Transcript_3509:62-1102(+)
MDAGLLGAMLARSSGSSSCGRVGASQRGLAADLEDDNDDERPVAISTRRAAARQRQIDIGKGRPEYNLYVQCVPPGRRRDDDPVTPDPYAPVSKRQFDRQLSTWRRQLHEYDCPAAADVWPGVGHAQSRASGAASGGCANFECLTPSASAWLSLELAALAEHAAAVAVSRPLEGPADDRAFMPPRIDSVAPTSRAEGEPGFCVAQPTESLVGDMAVPAAPSVGIDEARVRGHIPRGRRGLLAEAASGDPGAVAPWTVAPWMDGGGCVGDHLGELKQREAGPEQLNAWRFSPMKVPLPGSSDTPSLAEGLWHGTLRQGMECKQDFDHSFPGHRAAAREAPDGGCPVS